MPSNHIQSPDITKELHIMGPKNILRSNSKYVNLPSIVKDFTDTTTVTM